MKLTAASRLQWSLVVFNVSDRHMLSTSRLYRTGCCCCPVLACASQKVKSAAAAAAAAARPPLKVHQQSTLDPAPTLMLRDETFLHWTDLTGAGRGGLDVSCSMGAGRGSVYSDCCCLLLPLRHVWWGNDDQVDQIELSDGCCCKRVSDVHPSPIPLPLVFFLINSSHAIIRQFLFF